MHLKSCFVSVAKSDVKLFKVIMVSLLFLVKVKAKALILAEMNSFLQRRTEEDEKVNGELEHILQELQR